MNTPRITAELVRRLLDYDQDTGVFVYRERSIDLFESGKHCAAHNCAKWNASHAGKVAGSPDRKGYLILSIFGRPYKCHRLAWLYVTGEWPSTEVDHANLAKADNRFANLREATSSQNKANTSIRRNNTSGFKGVDWDKRRQKWRAKIAAAGKKTHLGYFDSAAAAHAAYCAASIRFQGEYARSA